MNRTSWPAVALLAGLVALTAALLALAAIGGRATVPAPGCVLCRAGM